MLKIYSSKTKEKSEFKPINPGQVSMYVCGMTVYDYCHLGHARMLVAFENIVNFLRFQNYKVNYVRNITDIDDKIINRANENGESTEALVDRFVKAMHEDEQKLGLSRPDHEPKATDYIQEIIELIQTIEQNGFAYKAENNDVYFRVKKFDQESKFDRYGALSHRNIDELMVGARIEANDQKEDPLDFVLWKASKPNEPSWDSPWGKGRPGWHIECSAMSMKHLGEHFDIHGGGADLLFPHHENETAQSHAAGCQYVNTWMHVGYLQVDQEKMSKSLGNFFTIREVLAKYPAEVVRYLMAASHYRSPLNYSVEALDRSAQSLKTLYTALRGVEATEPMVDSVFEKEFVAAMNDDFNTPKAVAVLFDLAKEVNRLKEQDINLASQHAALLVKLGNLFGVLYQTPESFLQSDEFSAEQVAQIESLIQQRNQARKDKDYASADAARDALDQLGVVIEDSREGTAWRAK